MDDAPRVTPTMGEAEDRVALARTEQRVLGRGEDVAVGRVDCEKLVGPNAFLVDAGGSEEEATVVSWSTDPATCPRDPAPRVEVTQKLDEQLPRGLFGFAGDGRGHHPCSYQGRANLARRFVQASPAASVDQGNSPGRARNSSGRLVGADPPSRSPRRRCADRATARVGRSR